MGWIEYRSFNTSFPKNVQRLIYLFISGNWVRSELIADLIGEINQILPNVSSKIRSHMLRLSYQFQEIF